MILLLLTETGIALLVLLVAIGIIIYFVPKIPREDKTKVAFKSDSSKKRFNSTKRRRQVRSKKKGRKSYDDRF